MRVPAWFVHGNYPVVCLFLLLLLTGCSSARHLPRSVEAELRAAAFEHNDQVSGWSGAYLDEITEVNVVHTVNPTRAEIDARLQHVDEFWCVTLEIWGLSEGTPRSVEVEWFAILKEGSSEWSLFPRHFVSYPYTYDLLCEAAAP